MTVYGGNRSVTATFGGASSVDTVVLTQPCFKVSVLNVTGSAPIYFTVSHPGGAGTQPTVGGTDDYVLPAAIGAVDVRHDGQFGTVVYLISSGTPTYSVEITS